MRRGIALVGAIVWMSACGRYLSDTPRSRGAILVVETEIKDATLWVDDRPVAQIRDLPKGIRLPSGFHRVEIRHDDYHTRYLEMTLRQGEVRRVQAELARRFD